MLYQRQLHCSSGLQTPPLHTQAAAWQRNSSRAAQLLLWQPVQASQLLVAPAAANCEARHLAGKQQQQQQTLLQQQQQVLPGRSLHSQQTDELLLLLHSATAPAAVATTAEQGLTQRQQQQQHGSSTFSQRFHVTSNGKATSPDANTACSCSDQQYHRPAMSAGGKLHNLHRLAPASQQQQQQQSQQWPSQQQQQQQQCPASRADAALLVHELRQCTQPQQLLAFLSAHALELDAVAVSAAIVHYARLVTPTTGSSSSSSSSRDNSSSSSHRLPGLLQHLLAHHLGNFRARQFANTLHALGRMHCRDKVLVDRLLQGLNPRVVAQLNPQELANIAWGLGRLRVWPDGVWMEGFYKAVGLRLQPQRAQQQQQQQHVRRRRQSPPPPPQQQQQQQQQETTIAANPDSAFDAVPRHNDSSSSSRRGSRQDLLLLPPFQQQQQQCAFKPQELANLIWGLGRLHATPAKPWLQQVLPILEQQVMMFTPQQLSNIAWGLAHFGGARPKRSRNSTSSGGGGGGGSSAVVDVGDSLHNRRSSGCYISQGLPTPELDRLLVTVAVAAQNQLAGFSSQELSCLVWGVARLQQQLAQQLQSPQQQQLHQPQQQQQQQQIHEEVQLGWQYTSGSIAAAAAEQSSLSAALQLAAGACSHLAAAAAPPRSAAAGQQQQLHPSSQVSMEHGHNSSNSTHSSSSRNHGCGSVLSSTSSRGGSEQHNFAKLSLEQYNPGQLQHSCQDSAAAIAGQQAAANRSTTQRLPLPLPPPPQQQQWLQQGQLSKHRGHVQASHLAMLLQGYRMLALQQQRHQQREWQQQQQQQLEFPAGLPQHVLNQLACTLCSYNAYQMYSSRLRRSSSSSSTLSSGSRVQHKVLPAREVPGFCSALLLLCQLGCTPNPSYMAAVLEVVHDKLHLLTSQDFEAVTACLEVLGYMPSKPWVLSFLQAVQPRLGGLSSEGLVDLFNWALKAERWFSKPASGSSSNRTSQCSMPADSVNIHAQQQQQQQRIKLLPGVVVQDGTVLQAKWLRQLVVVLRAKVGSRARQQAASVSGHRPSSSSSGSAAAMSLPPNLLQDVSILDVWLKQQLQQQVKAAAAAAAAARQRPRGRLAVKDSSSSSSSSNSGGHAMLSRHPEQQQQQQHVSAGMFGPAISTTTGCTSAAGEAKVAASAAFAVGGPLKS